MFSEAWVKTIGEYDTSDGYQKYVESWEERRELFSKYPAGKIFNGTEADKKAWNRTSIVIDKYEREIMATPIYDKLLEKYEQEMGLPYFLKDKKIEGPLKGWYQNSVGVLYRYDGTNWDNVPVEKISDLEYLLGG